MDYSKFKENFVEDVKRDLYESGIAAVEISTYRMEKMNETYDAMSVRPEGGSIGVNFRIENYFEAYADGIPYQDVVKKAVLDIDEAVIDMPEFDLKLLGDYEKVKEKLSLEVVSAERNAEILKTVPHKLIEDMAVVYKINLELGQKEGATALVNNFMLEMYGVSADELHRDAERNAAIIKPVILRGIGAMMKSMMSPEEADFFDVQDRGDDEVMYVATVPDKTKGAGVLAYDAFMDFAANRLGGDFFVLPSSVHEILLVKDDGSMSYRELKEMVVEINASEVSPEEQLTDSVYHYDSKNKVFELGEKFEKRRNQELVSGKAEKNSVLKDLKEKQTAVNEKPVEAKEIKNPVSKNRGGKEL